MPTDNARVFELVQAIGEVIDEAQKEGSSLSNTSRERLVRDAEKLAIAAREPEENLYFQATQVRLSCESKLQETLVWCILLPLSIVQTAQNAAIRAAINMGVFEKIPPSSDCISATDLSTTLRVNKDLLSESRAKFKVKQHITNKKPKT